MGYGFAAMKNQLFKNMIKALRKRADALRSRRFLRSVGSNKQHAAYIIGSPVYGNYGDSAILLAQMHFLLESLPASYEVFEITYSEYYKFRNPLRHEIDKSALIFCMGGGNMGNQWEWEELLRYNVLSDFPDNRVVIFPQTIFYSETGNPAYTQERAKAVYNGRSGLTLAAREEQSFARMKELFPETEILLIPDIVLWSSMERFGAVPQKRSGVLICRRSDCEVSVTDDAWNHLEHLFSALGMKLLRTEMDTNKGIGKEQRRDLVRQKMQEYCTAELVLTDRLHGMVFSALTGTPCIVFGNYNYKIRGTYEWIKYLPYIRYAESTEEAEQFIPELLAMKDCRYDNAPLMPFFEQLKEVVIKTCQGSV